MKHLHDLPADKQKAHEAHWGGYNEFPPNWREISEKDFVQSGFFTYDPVLVENRQMFRQIGVYDRDEKSYIGARLFFMEDGTGYALANLYWEGRMRYFKFHDCEHKNTRTTHTSNCYREWTCTDCGRNFAVDSSD